MFIEIMTQYDKQSYIDVLQKRIADAKRMQVIYKEAKKAITSLLIEAMGEELSWKEVNQRGWLSSRYKIQWRYIEADPDARDRLKHGHSWSATWQWAAKNAMTAEEYIKEIIRKANFREAIMSGKVKGAQLEREVLADIAYWTKRKEQKDQKNGQGKRD